MQDEICKHLQNIGSQEWGDILYKVCGEFYPLKIVPYQGLV
jgi:hypothetical protein